MRNRQFGQMLKAAISSIALNESKTAAIIEDELGAQIGLAAPSIQRYKAGYIPPSSRTIEILAEAAVTRGYLNRAWLQKFLQAARYPNAEKLLDSLVPVNQPSSLSSVVYENLPAPTYSRFVGRSEEMSALMEGLRHRSPFVVLTGFGGVGKTSLAREVACRMLTDTPEEQQLDGVVWVTDRAKPGTTTVDKVLDSIAQTMGQPELTALDSKEKRHAIDQLLRRARVLLIVDNAETIEDKELLSWLLHLPEPSKALITTRVNRSEFQRGSWPVELRGLREEEARTLVRERLRQLSMDQLASNQSQIDALVTATGGNPLAIELMLGSIKYGRRPLSQVLDDLYAARGVLFETIFDRAWDTLDQPAQNVLLAMVKLPDGVDNVALSQAAGLDGFMFDRAVDRLVSLALLDTRRIDLDSPSQYVMHPLVRAYVKAKRRKMRKYTTIVRKET